jgi:hypothetical protein
VIRINILICILVLNITLITSHAAMTGNYLLDFCKKGIQTEDVIFTVCLAYIVGFNDGNRATNDVVNIDVQYNIRDKFPIPIARYNQPYCIPNNVTASQLVRVIIKNLEDNPETLHLSARTLMMSIFKGKYPCYSTKNNQWPPQ